MITININNLFTWGKTFQPNFTRRKAWILAPKLKDKTDMAWHKILLNKNLKMFTPKLFVSSGKSKHLGVDEYLFNENKVCATTLKDSNEEEEHNDNNDDEKKENDNDNDDNELMNIYSTTTKFVRRRSKTPAQHFYLFTTTTIQMKTRNKNLSFDSVDA